MPFLVHPRQIPERISLHRRGYREHRRYNWLSFRHSIDAGDCKFPVDWRYIGYPMRMRCIHFLYCYGIHFWTGWKKKPSSTFWQLTILLRFLLHKNALVRWKLAVHCQSLRNHFLCRPVECRLQRRAESYHNLCRILQWKLQKYLLSANWLPNFPDWLSYSGGCIC